MCGNCGKTDHKYVDCPYVDMQFPLTKKEYAELKEKAKVYYCLKKWIEEIRVPTEESDEPYTLRDACFWIINTCECEILNGEYINEEEYRQMLEEEKK